MESRTLWVIHDRASFRQPCAEALRPLGLRVCPLDWSQLETRLRRELADGDWVLVDHDELDAAPLSLHQRFRELVWRSRVAVVTRRELPARLMQSGWVQLMRPLTCEQVEQRLGPLVRR